MENNGTGCKDTVPAAWLARLLVWTPGQTDTLKAVALALMILDHTNLILGLHQEWMRLLGRGAFPLFGLVWGANMARHTPVRQTSVWRLWGWAILAQLAWYLAGFPWTEGNILFAFAVMAQVLAWVENKTRWGSPAGVALIVLWLPFSASSFGVAGMLMLMLSIQLYREKESTERSWLALLWLVSVVLLNANYSMAEVAAGVVVSSISLGVIVWCVRVRDRYFSREFFPLTYSLHLAVLGMLTV